ncbi:hypothetical protein OESDEN_02489 [Oesophagostomum dentatum]|uniref:Uncharacterized protein n=1 Tax=Oesophagostomum dentatum TaxID=61180 RepID=A0A0B1TNX7_OESDE|nr:hypothetical protein OESDEN_02489 [Oesophagostomum dentatum]
MLRAADIFNALQSDFVYFWFCRDVRRFGYDEEHQLWLSSNKEAKRSSFVGISQNEIPAAIKIKE